MRDLITTVLDVAGLAGVTACAYFVWPPAALAVGGAAALAVSWRLSPRPVKREKT